MAETKERHGVSRALKVFFGVGDFGFTMMCSVENYFFNYFLTNLAQFSLPVVSLITTIASMGDMLLSWIYGAIMNSTKPGRFGRYRTWLICTTWAVPFLYALQFLKIGEGILPVVVIIVATIASHVLYTFPMVASMSLLTIATKTPEERAQPSSTRAIWNNASKVAFSAVGVPLASFMAGLIGEQNQYAGVAFCLALVMAVGFYAHFRMFDGYEKVEPADQAKTKANDKTSMGDLFKSLVENPSLICLMLANFTDYVYNFICSGVAIYYFTYVVNMPGVLATFIAISNVTAIIGSYLCKVLVKRFECRNVFIGTLLAMIACLLAAFGMSSNVYAVFILMSIAQLGYGIVFACTPVLYSDTITYSEWKTGKNATGWISGLQQIPLKAGIVARGLVISGCLAVAGWQKGMTAETVSAAVQQGICVAYMVIPAFVLACGAALLFFGFKLNKANIAQYQAEIDARKAAQN